MPFPPCRPRRPLPLELNCEIFKCLKLSNQRKFIWALGRGIYGMFGQQLLIKSTRLRNPRGNRWKCPSNNNVIIHPDGGFCLSQGTRELQQKVMAEQGFPISKGHSRPDHFPGTILYYFEINNPNSTFGCIWIGVSSSNESIPVVRSFYARSHAIGSTCCYISRERHRFEWPNGIQPIWEGNAKVSGCGLLLSPKDQLSIFFTVNGVLLCKPIPISPSADFLYPNVCIGNRSTLEVNFGDDLTKPFKYNIGNCPGMCPERTKNMQVICDDSFQLTNNFPSLVFP